MSLLDNNEKHSVLDHSIPFDCKMKFLKASMDYAIMAEMKERSAMGTMDIIGFFMKRFAFQLSPGTLYPILNKLEEKKFIRRLPNKAKRLYVLTDLGKKRLESLQNSLDEVHIFIASLIAK